ncbi:MAG: RluA family pseudouridine synthase [Pseudomonadota bacterium]
MAFQHVDPLFLVIEKPAGLLAVPGKGADKQDCVSSRVQALYPEALVVHRLDMATSGLMLMARSRDAQRRLCAHFENRQVHKRYVAVVAGRLELPGGTQGAPSGWSSIDLPIAVDWPRRPLRIIDREAGKPSLTHWRPEPGPDAQPYKLPTTRLLLEPLTGRSHQLRVHLQSIGHPILGDRLYAEPAIAEAAGRLLLHAASLGFGHPATGEAVLFTSLPPF